MSSNKEQDEMISLPEPAGRRYYYDNEIKARFMEQQWGLRFACGSGIWGDDIDPTNLLAPHYVFYEEYGFLKPQEADLCLYRWSDTKIQYGPYNKELWEKAESAEIVQRAGEHFFMPKREAE